jgi:AcrR family transcriptional regulator
MAEAVQGQPGQGEPAQPPLPPVIDLLWGRRERGKRGPQPGLSADAIVDAAVRIADADGLEAISMARVAEKLGFTTMALYRYVGSKDELLQLMFNASALGAETLVIEGGDWRSRLRSWAVIQRDMLDRHPWITQMPMPAPPLAPNSMHFVERALETMEGTGLTDSQMFRVIGLLSSYTLSEARQANDAARAAAAAAKAAAESGAESGVGEAPGPPLTYEAMLRALVDEPTFPYLYRAAWSPASAEAWTEREEFLAGIDIILDGVQALVDRAG